MRRLDLEYLRCPRCKNDVPVIYIFCPFCGYDLRFIIRERLIMGLSLKDRLYRIYYLLRSPLVAMKHIASAPDFLGAFIVFMIGTLLLLLKNLVVYLGFIGGISKIAFLYLFLNSLFLQFIFWLAFTVLFHIALVIMGGKGTFSDVLNVLGYSMIYIGIGHVFSMIFVVVSMSSGSGGLYPAYAYIPFVFTAAIFAGYSFSFTHLLKKATSIFTAIVVAIFFIIFLCFL